MRMAGKRVIEVKIQRFLSFEFVFWSKKFIAATVAASADMDGCGKRDNFGKDKHVTPLNKQTDVKLKNGKKEEKKDIDIVGFIKLVKEKLNISDDDGTDIISRSPMRKHDCHHNVPKPYDYPCSKSRVCDGVTRVVEAERATPAFSGRLKTTFQPGNVAPAGHSGDIDLCDVSAWLNLCRRDPKLLSDFVEDCQNEFSKRELSTFYAYRTSRNGCSKVSSQFAFSAQSPYEQSVTSPESTTWDESSLYQSKSPSVSSCPGKSLEKEKTEEEPCFDSSACVGTTRVNGYVSSFPSIAIHPNAATLERDVFNEAAISREIRPSDAFPNIGTVMLNLAESSYESTIDLNQISTVSDARTELTSAHPLAAEMSATTTTVPGTVTETAYKSPFSVATTECDALNQRLDPKAKETAWARINQLDIDILGKGDKDGDTQLMILLVSEKLTLEYVYVLVERLLKEKPEYLSCRNELNQDALYLAALKLTQEPIVASYIAEALVRGKQTLNAKYNGGNTLIHYLAKKGDTHANVLERLVKMKHLEDRTSLFDVNKKNNRGFTPLHVACESHSREVYAHQTVRILIENGADCTAKDYKDENTPLHVLIGESCDVDLVRILLETERKMNGDGTKSAAVVPNRQGNTALHLSCGKNNLPIRQQKDLIRLLLSNGAMIQLKNMNGCVPSVLLDGTRKQEVKTVFLNHRHKQSHT